MQSLTSSSFFMQKCVVISVMEAPRASCDTPRCQACSSPSLAHLKSASAHWRWWLGASPWPSVWDPQSVSPVYHEVKNECQLPIYPLTLRLYAAWQISGLDGGPGRIVERFIRVTSGDWSCRVEWHEASTVS